MGNYRFGKFTLTNDQVLFHEKQIVTVPPKELAVLKTLVSNAGKIISKEIIIRQVWDSVAVADESLTRCVYVLRKTLGDCASSRYIETVYGKGYRFVMPVEVEEKITQNIAPAGSEYVAIFPFCMQDRDRSLAIFDYITNLSGMFSDRGLEFMPAAMTVGSTNLSEHFSTLREAGASYFLTGIEVSTALENVMRLELIRSSSLKVIERASVILGKDTTLNLINLTSAISTMFNKAVQPREKAYTSAVVDVTAPACQIKDNYSSYSIFQFENFKHENTLTLNIKDYETSTLCNLAGCYLALAMLGIMEYERAEEIIGIITDRVITLEPNNALAVSMRALMVSNRKGHDESEFHLAMVLSPLSAEVYYYYACYLVRKQELDKALRLVTMSTTLNPNFFAAKILYAVVKAVSGDWYGAIGYAEGLRGEDSSCDIIIDSLLVVLYSKTGEQIKALSCLSSVKGYRDRCAFVSCVYDFVIESGEGTGDAVRHLQGITDKPLSRHSVYWLPFFDNVT